MDREGEAKSESGAASERAREPRPGGAGLAKIVSRVASCGSSLHLGTSLRAGDRGRPLRERPTRGCECDQRCAGDPPLELEESDGEGEGDRLLQDDRSGLVEFDRIALWQRSLKALGARELRRSCTAQGRV